VVNKLYLRANGIDISKARVRNKLVNGSPFGGSEVVIEVPPMEHMPGLGEITLEDARIPGLPDFKLEVKQGNGDWRTVSIPELKAILAGKPNG
jgi:hypothetical protein